MSGGEYQVSWLLQNEAAGFVNGASSGLDSSLSEVNNQVNSLMSTWTSDAQVAYGARQAQWNSAADRIKEALISFQTALASSAETSQSTEQTNVGIVSG
ncbi:WXG100 family type VII secretion target [Klenkia brasiliensis]|uniref:ESAT-6-like protein n=1 Tax=Klenkia brasiliensis TaxID=333142 RepID=A0A1G7QHH6_9ACTN|nr:WXG100 family type VII secretion target [Klenkia brasiliensis]SDF97962.1 WXG100 family type VII secretion target [Klenkia brasiliensis]